MLPAFAFLVATTPSGTTTPTVLCRWLEAATGTPHAFAAELRDYPLFLSLHSSAPARVEALVARALGGEWVKDGSTLRLMPIKPKPDEGLAEFVRAFKTSVDPQSPLAAVPPERLYATKAGGVVRFGYPEGRYVQPLPDPLKARVQKSPAGRGSIYLSRFANGFFQTKVSMPGADGALSVDNPGLNMRTLPPEMVAALRDEAKAIALDEGERAALDRLIAGPAVTKIDPRTIDRVDPLAPYVDTLLRPLAAKLKEDLVVALPDACVAGTTDVDDWTVGSLLGVFAQVDDWTVADGAFVGRLSAFERRNRTQTRRDAVARLIAQTKGTGVVSPRALADYMAAQRPAASECWIDMMTLMTSGIAFDDARLGDYPYNYRFAAALGERDWARLQAGTPLTADDLAPRAKIALLDLLANARERMAETQPDPALWPGFPDLRLVLGAKIEREEVLVGARGFASAVMTPYAAGSEYGNLRASLGQEPLYRVGQRRTLTLTVSRNGLPGSVETGFGEVTLDPKGKAVAWREMPSETAKAFERGVADAKGGR